MPTFFPESLRHVEALHKEVRDEKQVMEGLLWTEVMAPSLICPEVALCSAACVNGPQSVPEKKKSVHTSLALLGCCSGSQHELKQTVCLSAGT